MTLNNMAIVHEAQGNHAKALEHHERTLKIYLALYGEQHQDTAMTYNNMALVHQAQGDYGKALEFYERALKIHLATLGEQHDTSATLNNMAGVYFAQRDYSKALEVCERALKIKQAVHGEQHPDTASAYNNMASVLAKPATSANPKVNNAYENAYVGRISSFETFKSDYTYRLTQAAGVTVTVELGWSARAPGWFPAKIMPHAFATAVSLALFPSEI